MFFVKGGDSGLLTSYLVISRAWDVTVSRKDTPRVWPIVTETFLARLS